MGFDIEKLKEIAQKPSKECLEKDQFLEDNWDWLQKSMRIALMVSETIRKNAISQKMLAEKLNVSPQYVSKLLKGHENLSLETICRLEKVLNIQLIEVMSVFCQTEALTFSRSIKGSFTEWQSMNKFDIENEYNTTLKKVA